MVDGTATPTICDVDLWEGAPRPPRRWQAEALPVTLKAIDDEKRGVIWATTGCHARGQGILMFDGSVKAVEDIEVGDRLMGPDSRPRNVLRLIRGRDEMFEITPVKGESWVVNGDHVLSLVDTRKKKAGEITDVTVREWMTWTNSAKHVKKLFRKPVIFDDDRNVELPIEPYLLGVFLGDGSFSPSLSFCTADEEVVDYLTKAGERLGYTLRKNEKSGVNKAAMYSPVYGLRGRSYDTETGTLQNELIRLGLRNKTAEHKFVPKEYLVASRRQRLDMIAGLLDTDGHLERSVFDWISKSEQLADDLVFLCRSVGLAAYKTQCQKSCQNDFTGTYYRVSVSGDCEMIPNRVARRKSPPRGQIKDVLRTGFKIEPLGYSDDFFGFELDGDHRYLLDDFTVTHNSGKSTLLSQLSKIVFERLGPREIIVITTPTKDLVEQLWATVSSVVGAKNVGRFYSAKKELRRVIVTCNPSLPKLHEILEVKKVEVRLMICDEMHGTQADTLRETIPLVGPKSRIGFTATPYRAAKGESLELWDDVLYRYSFGDALRDGVLVDFDQIWDMGDQPMSVDQFVVEKIQTETEGPGIVSARTVADATAFAEALEYEGIPAMPIHGGMGKKQRDELIEKLRVGELKCLVHCNLLAEGVDLPWLRWIALRRPVGSVVRFIQELGRVLRVCPEVGKERALVIDPHNLLGAFGLGQAANLGEAVDEAIENELAEPREAAEPSEKVEQMPRTKAISELMAWTQRFLLVMQAYDMAESSYTTGSDAWRNRRPSDKQIVAILGDGTNKNRGLVRMTKYLPEEQRDIMKMVCSANVLPNLKKGAVSDILSILVSVANATREMRVEWATKGYSRKKFSFPEEMRLPLPSEMAILTLKEISRGE